MARYKIAPGRAIGKKSGGGVIRYGSPLPDLSAEDLARFIADGCVIIDDSAEMEPPQEPTPSPPSLSGGGVDSAPSVSVPSRWPTIREMPAFLEGLSESEVRFLQSEDPRVGASSIKVYEDALASLEAE